MQRARNIFSITVILRRGSKVFYGFSITTKKKLMKLKLSLGSDYNAYVPQFLFSIKSLNDEKFDMLSNRNSELLFYRYNIFLDINGFTIRYSEIVAVTKDENFNYNEDTDLNNDLILDVIKNLKICKKALRVKCNFSTKFPGEEILSKRKFSADFLVNRPKLSGKVSIYAVTT